MPIGKRTIRRICIGCLMLITPVPEVTFSAKVLEDMDRSVGALSFMSSTFTVKCFDN